MEWTLRKNEQQIRKAQMEVFYEAIQKLKKGQVKAMMQSEEFTARLIGIVSGQTESWRHEVCGKYKYW